MSVLTRFAGLTKVLTVFVVLALIAAVVLVFTRNDMERTLTVDFPRTNSLYKGSDVRILGVPVGEVKELKAQGDHVEVTLTYETDVRLPTDVKAVIISPAIVGDRFVQLAPAYSGGAVLADNAKLGVDRSEVPVELDEIFKSLDDLSIALGPKGANKDGSLSSLIEDSAKQLDGQGQQLHETLTNFAKLSSTLSDNKDELFGSVQEIEQFVALLERNDSSVRSFFDSTARVSNVLENERDDLAKTLEFLSKALIDVRRLIKDNRTTLRNNVDNLQSLAETLARRSKEIEHTLVDAPIALGNLGLAGGSPKTGTLDARADLGATFGEILTNPGALPALLCQVFFGNEAIPVGEQLCPSLAGLLDSLLPDNLTGSAAGAAPDAAAGGTEPPSPDQTAEELGDMLGVNP
jgi:virulence factor Mce-like protein